VVDVVDVVGSSVVVVVVDVVASWVVEVVSSLTRITGVSVDNSFTSVVNSSAPKAGSGWFSGMGSGYHVVIDELLMISSMTHAGGLLTRNCIRLACWSARDGNFFVPDPVDDVSCITIRQIPKLA